MQRSPSRSPAKTGVEKNLLTGIQTETNICPRFDEKAPRDRLGREAKVAADDVEGGATDEAVGSGG